MGFKPKFIAWNRKHQRTDMVADAIQERVWLPNGFRVAYKLCDPNDTFPEHLKKCKCWFELFKSSFPGKPQQKDQVLKSMMEAIGEIWPKELKEMIRRAQ